MRVLSRYNHEVLRPPCLLDMTLALRGDGSLVQTFCHQFELGVRTAASHAVTRHSFLLPFNEVQPQLSTTMTTLFGLPIELTMFILAEVRPLDLIRMSRVFTPVPFHALSGPDGSARCARWPPASWLIAQYGRALYGVYSGRTRCSNQPSSPLTHWT